MMQDPEIVSMQSEWNEKWRDRRRWILVEEADGTYSVHQHDLTGVSPPSEYPDKRKAAARLLQLLGIGPVAPQHWPEEVCIGSIEYESSQSRNTLRPEGKDA